MQADEQQAVAPAQLVKEPQHEPDVAVLSVQLRLIEQMHQRFIARVACASIISGFHDRSAGFDTTGGSAARAAALIAPHPMDVLPGNLH